MNLKKVLFSILIFGFSLGSLNAFVLEDFNSTSSVTTGADTGSTISISSVTGENGNALKLNYDLGTGGWAQVYKDYSASDFIVDGGNSLRFRYKATGSASNLEIKLTDNDGSTTTAKSDKIDLKFPLATDNQWKTMMVAFSSFTLFPDGNANFNYNQVSHIAFAVTALSTNTYDRGSGTVWIDKLELYKSTTTLIDDFNDGNSTNTLGGLDDAFHSTFSTDAVRQNIVLNGERVMEFDYNVSYSGSFAGYTSAIPNRNFQPYSHLSFFIRGKSGGEILKAKLESPSGSTELFISTYLAGGITTAFQEVQIPLADFTSVDISTVSKFVLVALNSIGSSSGTVYMDNIAFIRKGETPSVIRTLDEADNDFSSTNWELSAHKDASATASTISDSSVPEAKANNRVYKVDYSFTTTPSIPSEIPYVIAERPLYLSIAPYKALTFRYKGSGSSNNIELKLTDSDDTTWVKKFLQASNTGGVWKTATVPLDQLSFFSAGTDTILDMRKIKKVYFAISKSTGGAGDFTVDSLSGDDSGDFGFQDSSRLISSFKINNNPFSPNGDKIKDECTFTYTLGTASKVNLRIYGLDGIERKILFAGDQSAGEQSLTWDGTDSNSEKISNGLYLYRLEAEGADNRKDLVVQVVAVLK